MTTRKETLIQARNEWDARSIEQKAKHDAQYAEFRNAQNQIFDGIKNQILAALNGIQLNLKVVVDTGYSLNENSVRVYVKSNDDREHATDKALSWTWEVSLDKDSTINKKSSSWSGLQATTTEQIE